MYKGFAYFLELIWYSSKHIRHIRESFQKNPQWKPQTRQKGRWKASAFGCTAGKDNGGRPCSLKDSQCTLSVHEGRCTIHFWRLRAGLPSASLSAEASLESSSETAEFVRFSFDIARS